MTDTYNDTDTAAPDALTTIGEALLEISDTLESILALMQEREAGFKARSKASFGDRKPYARKSYDRDDRGGDDEGSDDRKPYARKSYGDKPAYGEKKSFGGGKRSFGGDKKSYGDKKPYAARGKRDDGDAAPRKKYKGGY